MKYLVFTTKHHDGFCMFDTKQTDYKITAADGAFSKNPRANLMKEVFQAFREEGIHAGAYFSKPRLAHRILLVELFPAKGPESGIMT